MRLGDLGRNRLVRFRIGTLLLALQVAALASADPAVVEQLKSKRGARQAQVEELKGKVVGVTDGDTITVLDAEKQQHKIRLQGIDAPEKGQPMGNRAKQALSDKIFSKEVIVKWRQRDRYRRILGEVYLDGRHINPELVAEGWAWHFKKYSSDEQLANAEVAARQKTLGLWADQNAVAPWEWRAQQKANAAARKASAKGQAGSNKQAESEK